MQETMFVDQYYVMDPEFEDLLPGGMDLKEGMVVLIGDSTHRMDIPHAILKGGWFLESARKDNRWCTVTNLEVETHHEYDRRTGELVRSFPVVTFIGVYGDGTKYKRSFDMNIPWLVKKDSIPPES